MCLKKKISVCIGVLEPHTSRCSCCLVHRWTKSNIPRVCAISFLMTKIACDTLDILITYIPDIKLNCKPPSEAKIFIKGVLKFQNKASWMILQSLIIKICDRD